MIQVHCALFLQREKASAGMAQSWVGWTDGSGQPLQTTLLPQFSVVLLTPDRSPMAGESGRKRAGFHMIRHCSPLAPGGPDRLRASRSKLRPGGWRRDEGTSDNSSHFKVRAEGLSPAATIITLGGITKGYRIIETWAQLQSLQDGIFTISPSKLFWRMAHLGAGK